jgi:EpsI family protein
VAEVLEEKDNVGGHAVIKTLVAIAFVGLNFYTYHYLATNPVYPERKSLAEFPLELGEWACAERQSMSAKVERNLGVTDYFICRFASPENRAGVDVYVGYHASQVREAGGGSGENSIHPPAHCLPGSGWDIVSNRTVPLDMPGLRPKDATVKRVVIAKNTARQLVYYWYQSRGRVISEDWKKIVFVGLDRAMRGRTDGSLVRFTVPILWKDEAKAEAAFRELAPRILTQLSAYVPE